MPTDPTATAAPLTVGALRRALKGISDDAWVTVQDDDGHWTPTSVEHLPIGGAPGQVVLKMANDPTATADTREDGCPRHGEVTHHRPGCPNIPSLDRLATATRYHCLRCDRAVPADEVHAAEWMPGRIGTFHTCGDFAHEQIEAAKWTV